MVALVVVADAGVRADDRGGFVDVVGVDLGRDERRRVAERTRVEDRRELAQHAGVLDLGDALAHLGLGHAEPLAEHGVRPGLEREVPLHGVEQLAVDVVELGLVGARRQLLVSRMRSAGVPCSRDAAPARRCVAAGASARIYGVTMLGERRRSPSDCREPRRSSSTTDSPGRSWRTSAITSFIVYDLVVVDRLDDVADAHARRARPVRRRPRSVTVGPPGALMPLMPERAVRRVARAREVGRRSTARWRSAPRRSCGRRRRARARCR